jgi:hypothetical protein
MCLWYHARVVDPAHWAPSCQLTLRFTTTSETEVISLAYLCGSFSASSRQPSWAT